MTLSARLEAVRDRGVDEKRWNPEIDSLQGKLKLGNSLYFKVRV